jgi:uncharacterized protein YlaN (UPF0358 family)
MEARERNEFDLYILNRIQLLNQQLNNLLQESPPIYNEIVDSLSILLNEKLQFLRDYFAKLKRSRAQQEQQKAQIFSYASKILPVRFEDSESDSDIEISEEQRIRLEAENKNLLNQLEGTLNLVRYYNIH